MSNFHFKFHSIGRTIVAWIIYHKGSCGRKFLKIVTIFWIIVNLAFLSRIISYVLLCLFFFVILIFIRFQYGKNISGHQHLICLSNCHFIKNILFNILITIVGDNIPENDIVKLYTEFALFLPYSALLIGENKNLDR